MKFLTKAVIASMGLGAQSVDQPIFFSEMWR